MNKNERSFANDEYYHIFNRGVDKRNVFGDEDDIERFLLIMRLFNQVKPIKSIKDYFVDIRAVGGLTAASNRDNGGKLIEIVCYCLNPNHFHFLLKQVTEGGISEYMKRLGAYTWYFNKKYARNGSLFQGTFKSSYIGSNDYLLHLSAYINLNYEVHDIGNENSYLVRSSWEEYVGKVEYPLCAKNIILDQFKNIDEYQEFAHEAVKITKEKRAEDKTFSELLQE